MCDDNPASSGDYAAQLLEFVQADDPAEKIPEPLEPPKKRRGPKEKLVKQKLGAFFRAIAEINSKNRKRSSDSSIATELKQTQKFSGSQRHLRRQVRIALDKIDDLLLKCPLNFWEETFGILPPSSKEKRLLREKSLEFLRHQLTKINDGQNR